jgi:hypothetical protein
MQATQKGFIDFVNDIESDQEIEHTSNWEGCAVGEYLLNLDSNEIRYADYFANQLLNPLLMEYLNQKIPETYGDLQEFIKNNIK